MIDLAPESIDAVVVAALREDIGSGDLSTLATIPAMQHAEARMVLRETGVVAGLPVVAAVFAAVDPSLHVAFHVAEGSHVAAGTTVATVRGSARGILAGERVALNLIQRMCGIATQAARYVEAVKGTRARILDTRKTTPGLRALEKYAVRVGGALNHRFGLYDAVMLKDNHLALLAAQGISAAEAVLQVRAAVGPLVVVEVECETVEAAIDVAEAGADMILLDNMPPDELRAAVRALGGRVRLEASGGVTLDTVRAVAETGVDFISVGALTHAVRALDVGLDID